MSTLFSMSLMVLINVSSTHGIYSTGIIHANEHSNSLEVHSIQNSQFFNQNAPFSASKTDQRINAVSIILPYLDVFHDDNIIPAYRDVVFSGNIQLNKFNPYYFIQNDLLYSYFSGLASNLNVGGSDDIEYLINYFQKYFSYVGVGDNVTNQYYDLIRETNTYSSGDYPYDDFYNYINNGYLSVMKFNANRQGVDLGLVVGHFTEITIGYFTVYDLKTGTIKDVDDGYAKKWLYLKMNTAHNCSDNFTTNGFFYCLKCKNGSPTHHDHYFSGSNASIVNSTSHQALCTLCETTITENHTFDKLSYYNQQYHYSICTTCNYSKLELHKKTLLNPYCPCQLAS